MTMTRRQIEIDDELLDAAARELGTSTNKDTVNEALRLVAQRRIRVQALLNEPRLPGWGEDITNPEIMRDAHR